ncbi:hypothetical protein NE237_031951 [Protea cynaroides]|uniref:Piwi domain-containing protein n=1 Tax=Protea cynaroides TaxID=273540 RepID=A0A9Q0L3C1_9MAGN|nr:hypothetical protein NE237_031951 [Protea cynaroides]
MLEVSVFWTTRIMCYRDGVSEGQFFKVLLFELDAIRKACASLEPNYQLPVTFIVVQKRHHARLFANNQKDRISTDKSGNILPGTVVDSKICAHTLFLTPLRITIWISHSYLILSGIKLGCSVGVGFGSPGSATGNCHPDGDEEGESFELQASALSLEEVSEQGFWEFD